MHRETFFLLAELVKEAGNKVLSHRMGVLSMSQNVSFTLCHVSQFFMPIKCCRIVVWQTKCIQCVQMFFLPARLVKEAGKEVLSYWMWDLGTSSNIIFSHALSNESAVLFLADIATVFPTLHPISKLYRRISFVNFMETDNPCSYVDHYSTMILTL